MLVLRAVRRCLRRSITEQHSISLICSTKTLAASTLIGVREHLAPVAPQLASVRSVTRALDETQQAQ